MLYKELSFAALYLLSSHWDGLNIVKVESLLLRRLKMVENFLIYMRVIYDFTEFKILGCIKLLQQVTEIGKFILWTVVYMSQ